MSTVLWFVCAAVYLLALTVLGVATLRKGHFILFGFGIFLPFLWIIGAFMGPTPRATQGGLA